MIAVDGLGKPVPVISRAHIVSGQGYVEVSANEGVVLDDMVFDPPAAP